MLTMSINKFRNNSNYFIQKQFLMMRMTTKIFLTLLPSLMYRVKVYRNEEIPVDMPDPSG